MTKTNFKPALSLILSLSALVTASAQADDFLRASLPKGNFYTDESVQRSIDAIRELNNRYLGNGAGLNVHGEKNLKGEYVYIAELALPGYEKRYGVFKLQKTTNNVGRGPREDLVFNSETEANNFCKVLTRVMMTVWLEPNAVIPDVSEVPEIPIYAIFSTFRRSIAVPYWIAYDTGSKERPDGTSTPMQKHVMCTNPWSEAPSDRPDENKMTGIKASSITKGSGPAKGSFYNITCMDSRKKPGSFYVYGGTLHQHNQQEGAQYCPMS